MSRRPRPDNSHPYYCGTIGIEVIPDLLDLGEPVAVHDARELGRLDPTHESRVLGARLFGSYPSTFIRNAQ